MMSRVVILVFIAAVLAGCSEQPEFGLYKPTTESAQEQRELMVGNWYGFRTVDAGKQQWITRLNDDGTYIVRFHFPSQSGEGSKEVVEVGFWGVSANIHFTIMRGWLNGERFSPSDPSDATFYDAYELMYLTEDVMRYKSLEVGYEFEAKRVSDDFDFPE